MKIHEFENGVKVYDEQLLDVQKLRYEKRNVHEEDEEDIFIETIKSLPNHANYVNVGTAIGYYPLLTKKIRPDIKIYCFEPLPLHLAFFHENISLNGFNTTDFMIFDMAISSISSTVGLKDESFGSYVTSGTIDQSSISVNAIVLSDIFNLIGQQDIDFLQMDIQGHEESVLTTYFSENSQTTGSIKSFLIGTHGDHIHSACRTLFLNNGYKLKLDEPNTKNQPDGIIYCCIQRPASVDYVAIEPPTPHDG